MVRLDRLVIHAADACSKAPFILSHYHLYAPSLQNLDFRECGIDWKSDFLTILGLGKFPDDSLLECREFVQVVSNTPLLEEISLALPYIQDEESEIPSVSKNVDFLEIHDHARNIAHSLDYIALSPSLDYSRGTDFSFVFRTTSKNLLVTMLLS